MLVTPGRFEFQSTLGRRYHGRYFGCCCLWSNDLNWPQIPVAEWARSLGRAALVLLAPVPWSAVFCPLSSMRSTSTSIHRRATRHAAAAAAPGGALVGCSRHGLRPSTFPGVVSAVLFWFRATRVLLMAVLAIVRERAGGGAVLRTELRWISMDMSAAQMAFWPPERGYHANTVPFRARKTAPRADRNDPQKTCGVLNGHNTTASPKKYF